MASLRSYVGHVRCAAGAEDVEEMTWPQPGPPEDTGSGGRGGGAEETQIPSFDWTPLWTILLTLTH